MTAYNEAIEYIKAVSEESFRYQEIKLLIEQYYLGQAPKKELKNIMEQIKNNPFLLMKINGNRIELPSKDAIQIEQNKFNWIKKLMTNNNGEYKSNGYNFPFDPTELLEKFRKGNFINEKKQFQFYPTPREAVDELFQISPPLDNYKILEPSIGQGHIIKHLYEFCGWANYEVDAYELNTINRAILKKEHPEVNLLGHNFLEAEPNPVYDYVYMNPPFTVKGDKKHYLTHIEHALGFLNEYGELLAIAPSSFIDNESKRLKEFKEKYQNQIKNIRTIEKGAFKSSGTNVGTALVHIRFWD